jgi:hypothetical protein
MKKIVISFAAFALLVLPVVALAQVQGVPDTNYIEGWVAKLLKLVQQATTFLMIAATLYFLYTVFTYIKETDATKAKEKKNAIGRGILGLFIMVAVWGIVRLLATTLGISTGPQSSINVPCPPGMQYSTTMKACI